MPVAPGYKLLKETVCECGQPIIALQAPDKTVSVMHKKPACAAWEKNRAAAFNAQNAERLRRRGRGFAQPQTTAPTNRHARRRAEALARKVGRAQQPTEHTLHVTAARAAPAAKPAGRWTQLGPALVADSAEDLVAGNLRVEEEPRLLLESRAPAREDAGKP